MDSPLAPRRGRRIAAALAVAAAAVAGIVLLRTAIPDGLRVRPDNLRIATVEKAVFADEVAVRASAIPQNSVMLDAVDGGRVEEVIARDGMLVRKGELLFRLSNPQRHLELLARRSEHAQQIANLSALRVSLEGSRTEHRRRLSDLAFQLDQAGKQHARLASLAERGFVAPAAVDDAADKLAQARRAHADELAGGGAELAIKRDAVRDMERAIAGLDAGLALVQDAVDALAVRAPADGRLTDFRLEVGQTVRPDQRLGRIDDPGGHKLAAQVDEYYLPRMSPGRPGRATIGAREHAVAVQSVRPQIRDGRFTVELQFTGESPPGLRPGQGTDVRISLGDAAPAVVLPAGGYLNDSGGAWVYVLDADGKGATRRPVRIGRRSHAQAEVLGGVTPGDKVIVSGYAAYGGAERLQIAR